MKKLTILIVVGLCAWFIYFLVSKNRHAVAHIQGAPCPELSFTEVRGAGVTFSSYSYFRTDRDETVPQDRVNIYPQKGSTGLVDCFVALSDTRCDMSGPSYFHVSNKQKSIYFQLLEDQSAVLQGNADHLTCTIPTASDVDR